MRTGPRSNFSMLPAALRWKIIFMIDDGATFEAVANDPEIAGEYKKRGLRLTAPAMSGIKKSKEYQEVTAARRRKQLADRSSQLTTALLRDAGTLETVSDQARVKLIQALSDLSDLPENSDLSDGDRVKALRSLAQSVAALTNPAKDNQIAELKRKLREKDDEIEAAEKEHAAEIARLNFELKKRDDEIAELRKLAGTVDNEAVIQKLNESVGLT
nr:MAG TPA: hypothetical protein [Caudoviricetes sp.]